MGHSIRTSGSCSFMGCVTNIIRSLFFMKPCFFISLLVLLFVVTGVESSSIPPLLEQEHVETMSTSDQHKLSFCSAGFVRRSSRCVACPAGTYRDASDKRNQCQPCPAGTFQPVSGATSRRLCRPCYPGTFAKSISSATCAACKSGTSSGFGASSCVSCKPGFQISFRGASCEPCGYGEFSTIFNSPRCEQCLYGVVNRERTRCRSCIKGDACYTCPRAMYRPQGGECMYCPLGMEVPSELGVGTSVADCKPCRKGYARGVYDSQCVKCGPGSSAVAEGATACRRQSGDSKGEGGSSSSSPSSNPDAAAESSCPYDAFVNARGVCESCATGYRRDLRRNVCVSCGAGGASLGGKATACWTCPVGTKLTAERDACTCGDGSFLRRGKCAVCPAGSFRTDEQHRPYSCETCPTGHVSAAGSAACTRCPYGSVADRKHVNCVRCPSGSIPNFLSEIDLYYEYGQSRCVNARTGAPLTNKL